EHAPDLDLRADPARAAVAPGERRRLPYPGADDHPRGACAAADTRERDPEDGRLSATMDILNPATAEGIEQGPAGTVEDADAAVEAAKHALPGWLDSTPGERGEILLKLADVVDAHADELARIESRNVGKPLAYARDEMPVCSDNLRFFA